MISEKIDPKLLARRQQLAPIPNFPQALESKNIRLEVIDPERHGEALFAAANDDPAIWQYMFGGPYPDPASFRTYLKGLHQLNHGLALCVLDRASAAPIGVATYCSNVPEMMRIEVGGIWYTPRFQRSYANTETLYLMLKHAFETLSYRRVEWKCDAANSRSRAAALRLGFHFEGIFRNHMIIKERNRDTAWFALTDQDWPEAKANLETKLK